MSSPIEQLATIARLHDAKLTVAIGPEYGAISFALPGKSPERIHEHSRVGLNYLAAAMIRRVDVCRDISLDSLIDRMTPTQRARCYELCKELSEIRRELLTGVLANEPNLQPDLQSSLHPARLAAANVGV